MEKLKILCVHGLGDHRESLWKDEWQTAVEASFPESLRPELQFEFLTYDPIFEGVEIDAWEIAGALWKLTSSAVGSSFRRQKGIVTKVSEKIRWTAGYVVAWVEDDEFQKATRKLVLDTVRDFRPDVILAHSLGSLITYNALTHSDAAAAKNASALRKVRYVTLGSQIANPFVVRNLTPGRIEMPAIKSWHHLYNEEDDVFTAPISLPLEMKYSQVETFFDKKGYADHDAVHYLSHTSTIAEVWRPIAEEWNQPDAAKSFGKSLTASRSPGARAKVKRARTSTRKSQRAVLIGINDYPAAADRLEGCVNDVYRMSEVLQECGFAASNIRVCVNDRATAKGIQERLQWLLDGAMPGDELVFYYSGHGAQIPEYGENNEPDRVMETLVPYNFDWSAEHAVTDEQIYQYYSQLPYDVRFAMILDCCHSGGMHRSSGPRVRGLTPPDDIRHRELEWDLKERMWVRRGFRKLNAAFSDDETASRLYYGEYGDTVRLGRASSLRGTSKKQYDLEAKKKGKAPFGPYLPLIIQACAEGEYSYEYRHGSVSFGAFTYAMTDTLRAMKVRPTYAGLLDRVKEKLKQLEYEQTPQVLGPKAIVTKRIPWDVRTQT